MVDGGLRCLLACVYRSNDRRQGSHGLCDPRHRLGGLHVIEVYEILRLVR
jgi:hypothetical protein